MEKQFGQPALQHAPPARSRSGVSLSLGQTADTFWLAGHSGYGFHLLGTGLKTMQTQVGWKDSHEIGNTSGVLSGIKPAAGD